MQYLIVVMQLAENIIESDTLRLGSHPHEPFSSNIPEEMTHKGNKINKYRSYLFWPYSYIIDTYFLNIGQKWRFLSYI